MHLTRCNRRSVHYSLVWETRPGTRTQQADTTVALPLVMSSALRPLWEGVAL